MTLNELTGEIISAAMKVHSELGPGLLESAYQGCLLFELHRRGIEAIGEVELPVIYHGAKIDVGYRLDILVAETVILEIKSVESLAKIHSAQLITYLKLSNKPVGLLLNFNVLSLKDGIKRLVGPAYNSATL
jgi:GxxExxY protein